MTTSRDVQRAPYPVEYVVGVDGTPASLGAARWAADRAARDGATLVVVHAYQVNPLPSVAGPVRTAEMRRVAKDHARYLLRACLLDLPDTAEGVMTEGPADRVLIECSKSAGLLVLGARPQHTHPRMRFLGSIALRCLRGAECPVVLVPAQPAGPAVTAGAAGALSAG